MPVAPNTSASMIVRTATPNAVYNIYNLGQNQMLAAATPIGAIGDNWNFAGPGAVNWDFAIGTIDLFVSREIKRSTPTISSSITLVGMRSQAARAWARLDSHGRLPGSATSLGVTSAKPT
jgi:hypothetical protein